LVSCSTPDPYAVVSCPYIGVLDDASEITRFKYGGDRDVSDIEFHGEITRVEFHCTEPEGKNVVIGRAVVHTKFEKGMSATLDRQFFNLFIALSEREDRVVDKSTMTIDVEFKDGNRVVTEQTTIKNIRVPTNGDVPPELHNLYIGFQLTPAEVAYNRTKNKSH
jgi:hypothetical protein